MKPALPHILWATLAVAAFAIGRSTTGDNPDGGAAASSLQQTVLSAAQGGSQDGGAARLPASEETIRDVRAFVDGFRVSSTGGINSEGMSDAIHAAIRETDRVRSSLMFAMLMDELTPENAQAARDSVAESVSGWEAFRYLGLLNYRWGEIDGPAAVLAASSASGRESGYGTSIALSGWATNDPDAALEWINSQEDLEDRQRNWWRRGAISGLASTDSDRATEIVESLAAEDTNVGRFVEAIARQKIKLGGTEAERWMAGLENPEMRSSALGTLLDHTARSSSEDAFALAGRYANDPESAGSISEFARRMADRGDAESAISFAASLPSGRVRTETIKDVYRELAREAPELGEAAINRLPGDERDLANSAYASRLRDGARGFEIAIGIGDPELQREALIASGGRWLQDEPEVAAQAIALQPVDVQDAIVAASKERGGGGRRR